MSYVINLTCDIEDRGEDDYDYVAVVRLDGHEVWSTPSYWTRREQPERDAVEEFADRLRSVLRG